MTVEGNRSHRVHRHLRRKQVRLGFPNLLLESSQALHLAWNDQVFVLAERDAVLAREALGALADEVNMRAVAENLARQADRIRDVLDTTHAASPQRGSFHDQSVQLHLAVAIEEAAPPGVKCLVIFHDDDRLLDRVQSGATALENAPPLGRCLADTLQVRLYHVIGNRPGATMHYQDRICRQENPSQNWIV